MKRKKILKVNTILTHTPLIKTKGFFAFNLLIGSQQVVVFPIYQFYYATSFHPSFSLFHHKHNLIFNNQLDVDYLYKCGMWVQTKTKSSTSSHLSSLKISTTFFYLFYFYSANTHSASTTFCILCIIYDRCSNVIVEA